MQFYKSTLLLAILFAFATVAAGQGHIWGVAYGVDYTNCPTYDKIVSDLKIVKTFSNRIRIYACFYCNNICYNVTKATQELGMELLIGLQPAPETEWGWELLMLEQIQTTIGFGSVVGITVGSETLLRKDMTSAELSQVIIKTREFVRQNLSLSLPIGSADTFDRFDDLMINACDEIYINAFPYWEGINPIDVALQAMFDHYDVSVRKANGKPVYFGEIGWPTVGYAIGDAVATPERLRAFMKPFVCEARLRNVKYYWFEAFDRNTRSGAVEDNWGLYTSDLKRKPSYEEFSCDDWVINVTTPNDRNRPSGWTQSITHDSDYDGDDIKTSSANPRNLTSTSTHTSTSATTATSDTNPTVDTTPSTTTTEAAPSSSQIVLETTLLESSSVVDQGTISTVGRQQTGSATSFSSSILFLLASCLFLV